VDEVFRDFSGRSAGFDVIAALGWVAAAPNAKPSAASDAILRLLDLLDSDLPSPNVREEKTDEGTRLEVGAQTLVYTDLLPDVIGGIARIVCSGKLPKGILERAVKRLVEKYRALVEYREVWAPGNMVELARAMAEIARRKETPAESRLDILEALRANVHNLSTARILSEACSEVDERSRRFQEIAAGFAKRLFELLVHADYREREDRRVIVAALGRLALCRGLKAEFRSRAVEALLEEYAPDFREGRAVLEKLAAALPKEIRRKIEAVFARS
jgi:hypothetical protein